MREVIREFRIACHELRDAISAIGHSRHPTSTAFLRELLDSDTRSETDWSVFVDAFAAIGDAESRLFLLRFAHQDDPGLTRWEASILSEVLAGWAARDEALHQEIVRLCGSAKSSAQRSLVSEIVSHLVGEDGILAALDMIDEKAKPAMPRGIRKRLEDIFVKRYPVEGSAHISHHPPR